MAPCSDAARRVLADAIRARVFPAATVEVGSSAGPLWQDALGTLSFDAGASAIDLDTPFDLASLTKPIATTTVLMQLVAAGAVMLAEPVSSCFPEWTGRDRQDVTMADLLEHASGLSARLLDVPPLDRREFEHEICAAKLEYVPRTRSIYSDLGFILLGFVAEDRGGATLALQFESIAARLGAPLAYGLPEDRRRQAAPTTPLPEDIRRGRVLVGEVHDNYAAALGGVAGHAGLFGTAPAVGVFARAVLNASRGRAGLPPPFSPQFVGRFTARSLVPGQFARSRLGHDAHHIIVRHADVAVGVRARRFHGDVPVDRSRPRPLFRAADQPRPRRRIAGADARRPARLSRFPRGLAKQPRPSS